MKLDFSQRFGFLVKEVGRLYNRRFDQLARRELGLTLAQCRLLGTLAAHGGDKPMSQAEVAEVLDLSAMGVASLCDRMESAGWVRRKPSATDRRVNELELDDSAHAALESAMAVGDAVQAHALAGFNAAERAQFMALLKRVQANLAEGAAR